MLAYNENGAIQVIDHEALERKLNWGREFHFTELNNEQMELVGCISKLFKFISARYIIQKLKIFYWSKFQADESERFTGWLRVVYQKKLNSPEITFEECLKI